MAQKKDIQEQEAAAEEREEILEVANEDNGIDMTAVPTPEATESNAVLTEDDVDDSDEEATEGGERTTKAGKRSAKAQREADEEEARKESAQNREVEAPKPRVIQRPNPLKQHGKNYRAAMELVDRNKQYELAEAVELVKKTAKTKFDSSVEMHINLGVDPRQADQMVRSTVTLPAGTGKKLRVAVLAPAAKHADAKKAGAEIISDGDLITAIDKGQLDFDILVATPDMMAQLSKVARVLGPRGLMPNPKSGTVTPNVGQAVEQAKAGRVEFRIDKQAIVHVAIGKASFTADQIGSNVKALVDAILKAKPASTKGTYVRAVTMTASMGPGIKLDVQNVIAEANPKR